MKLTKGEKRLLLLGHSFGKQGVSEGELESLLEESKDEGD